MCSHSPPLQPLCLHLQVIEAHSKGTMTALSAHPNAPLLATATNSQVGRLHKSGACLGFTARAGCGTQMAVGCHLHGVRNMPSCGFAPSCRPTPISALPPVHWLRRWSRCGRLAGSRCAVDGVPGRLGVSTCIARLCGLCLLDQPGSQLPPVTDYPTTPLRPSWAIPRPCRWEWCAHTRHSWQPTASAPSPASPLLPTSCCWHQVGAPQRRSAACCAVLLPLL